MKCFSRHIAVLAWLRPYRSYPTAGGTQILQRNRPPPLAGSLRNRNVLPARGCDSGPCTAPERLRFEEIGHIADLVAQLIPSIAVGAMVFAHHAPLALTELWAP